MTGTPTSLDALGIKPVAWLYNCDGDVWTAALEPEPIVEDDWTETPLYSATDLAPLIAKARRVEELEAALKEMLRRLAASQTNWHSAAIDAQNAGNFELAVMLRNTVLQALAEFPEAEARAALKEIEGE